MKKPTVGPIVVERHDLDDDHIAYELWDYNPNTYHRVCKIDEFESDHAKQDAELMPQR